MATYEFSGRERELLQACMASELAQAHRELEERTMRMRESLMPSADMRVALHRAREYFDEVASLGEKLGLTVHGRSHAAATNAERSAARLIEIPDVGPQSPTPVPQPQDTNAGLTVDQRVARLERVVARLGTLVNALLDEELAKRDQLSRHERNDHVVEVRSLMQEVREREGG